MRAQALEQDDRTRAFMTQAVLSLLSDAVIYPAPMAFELKDFTQVQASVFQVARAPWQERCYLGCALLILGVFAMLYIRERRVGVVIAPGTGLMLDGAFHQPQNDGRRPRNLSSSLKIDRGAAPQGHA